MAVADHIVWGGVDSSSDASNTLEGSSSLKAFGKQSKQHLIEDILRCENSSSDLLCESAKEEASALQIRLDDTSTQPVLNPNPRRMQKAKQALIDKGVDVDELLAQVPRDDHGMPTSIGSIGHDSQNCHEVCPFTLQAKGCANGIFCNSCHLPHAPRKKTKDGKTRRDRYRRLKDDMKQQLEGCPDDFKFDSTGLPPWIAKDERLAGKLLNSLRTHHCKVKKELVDL